MNSFDQWWDDNKTEIRKQYDDGTLHEFIWKSAYRLGWEQAKRQAANTCHNHRSDYGTGGEYIRQLVVFDDYNALRKSCVVGDVLVCLASDTVAWETGKRYDIVRFDIDSIVVSRQSFGEFQWIWPWGKNRRIEFGLVDGLQETPL